MHSRFWSYLFWLHWFGTLKSLLLQNVHFLCLVHVIFFSHSYRSKVGEQSATHATCLAAPGNQMIALLLASFFSGWYTLLRFPVSRKSPGTLRSAVNPNIVLIAPYTFQEATWHAKASCCKLKTLSRIEIHLNLPGGHRARSSPGLRRDSVWQLRWPLSGEWRAAMNEWGPCARGVARLLANKQCTSLKRTKIRPPLIVCRSCVVLVLY